MRFSQIGFLTRFASVLLVVVIGMSVTLSYVFTRNHLNAVRNDLMVNAVGQASATLQDPLDRYARSGAFTESDRREIDAAVRNVKNFQALVRDVRLYRPDGRPLDPILAPDAASSVKQAVSEQNIIQGPVHTVAGEPIVTAFVPLASPTSSGYVAVAAIDISLGQLNDETSRETQFVVGATIAACAFIFVSLLTLAIAAQNELNRRRRQAETTFLQTMEGLAAIVDQRDPYTAGHSRRVSEYSVAIAEQMRLRARDVDHVKWSALLHDLGKIGVPDAVLLKNGPLDPHEREIINGHPTIAKQILGPVEAMAPIVPCVLHHHERWDGRGYPDGLAGDAIPLLSRIIAVADTFDAMTTDRPYRQALSVEEAKRRLVEGAGVQWDMRCIDAAVALIDGGLLVPPKNVAQEFGPRLGLGLSASHQA
ncbi:MAG TPA: HD-GYP domain-containing protein [Candidatus Aquilonibacter sp.]|nr:HD-GYP domain-containing protein [Candidatus Aquilonibacter sp.]